MGAVIDASFAATLFLPDEGSARAAEQFAVAAQSAVIAPVLWQIEITNILIMAQRRKRITTAVLGQLAAIIDRLPVELELALTPGQRGAVINLALSHGLTAYDAVYLELAIRRGFVLLSLDSSLLKAARALGVGLMV